MPARPRLELAARKTKRELCSRTPNMSTILDRIVASKRTEIEEARKRTPESELKHGLNQAPAIRDFRAALEKPPGIQVIAEIKRASPSAGVMQTEVDVAALARTYEKHGAACISVLTDKPFFHGSLDDLMRVRQVTDIPLLRKDFILDRYQVLEARLAGADAVLLIAELLEDDLLSSLLAEIRGCGMEALVELYDSANLLRVLKSGATLIGINNRNLHTFETSLEHTIALAPQIPRDRCLVSESGIQTRKDVERLQSAGAKAILVGETLMRAGDPGAKLGELLGR